MPIKEVSENKETHNIVLPSAANTQQDIYSESHIGESFPVKVFSVTQL